MLATWYNFYALINHLIFVLSVGALQGLLTNNLVALKGSCPNCGEQVSFLLQVANLNVYPYFMKFIFSVI